MTELHLAVGRDSIYDAVVEEVERVVVAEHDFEGTREEYEKE